MASTHLHTALIAGVGSESLFSSHIRRTIRNANARCVINNLYLPTFSLACTTNSLSWFPVVSLSLLFSCFTFPTSRGTGFRGLLWECHTKITFAVSFCRCHTKLFFAVALCARVGKHILAVSLCRQLFFNPKSRCERSALEFCCGLFGTACVCGLRFLTDGEADEQAYP